MKIKLNYKKKLQGQPQPYGLRSYNWEVGQEAACAGMKVVGERVKTLQQLAALDRTNESETV